MDSSSDAAKPRKSQPKLHVTFEVAGTVRKRGQVYRIRRELEAMEYVRQRTSLPIPRVLESHIEPHDDVGGSWFLMEHLPGSQIGDAWPSMAAQARATTLAQLRGFFAQLHALSPSGQGWVGSCSHGPVYDHRIDNMTECGPFNTVGEFYDYLVAPMKKCPKPELAQRYREKLPDACTITFAHADVSWENILVDPETGDVTGILDWETAGFWPEWWEYRKAMYGGRSYPWWIDIMKAVMHDYPDETEAEMDIEMF